MIYVHDYIHYLRIVMDRFTFSLGQLVSDINRNKSSSQLALFQRRCSETELHNITVDLGHPHQGRLAGISV